ncbi:PTS trehalose transporter subunit IIBC [Virgibacillus indicus]|uniref:PTS trehalose transporter subunit IIBC n=1 Tax=Virgibacillus indicus TaxID=2024554 RepID=A0A265NCX7_9BACI|nr:PTS system trehalose-specific EIIBC component [Virgibacillus indicus]OZU89146.1 PTS trehalose transporter subunit IIBC [Virgibacillus indicus]
METIYSPLSGRVLPLEDVPDPTFSQKMMGDGLAIEPADGKVVSPVNGEIVQIFPTKHAIGIQSGSGVEILIHIGLETVSLDGEGFEAHVKQGDTVKVGNPLVTFNLDFIKEKASSHISPIVITNGDKLKNFTKTDEANVTAGESMLFQASLQNRETEEKAPLKKKSNTEYGQEADEIIAAVGGIDNVNAATHCVTRLRFALSDEDKVDKEALENMNIVKGSFSSNGQFQVVIGQGTVDKVYKAMVEETGISEATKEEVKAAGGKKQNPLQRAIKVLADIFIPILPAIVTAGLLMGINNILANPGIFFDEQSLIEVYPEWAGIADMINIIANAAFTFLPALIGWSAVKRFGGNELLGVVLGLIMVHPALLSAWDYGTALEEGTIPTWNLFGFEVDKMGYQGQVLPVLFASWILAKIEIYLNKRVMDSLQLLIVAPVALLVTGFLTFIIIGPATFAIGNWITDGLVAIFDQFAILGGLVYGALYAPLVITGMHHTFLAVDLQLIGSTDTTFLWPILALSNIAQGAAAFAMMLVAKDEKLKGLSGTSGISAWLGITEPAMFGVNLRFKYPFVAAVIGSSIAGAFITMQNVLANSIGVGGVPGIFSIVPEGWGSFLIGMAIVMVVPFIITFFIAKRKLNTH